MWSGSGEGRRPREAAFGVAMEVGAREEEAAEEGCWKRSVEFERVRFQELSGGAR
jgi:hypothetical protein